MTELVGEGDHPAIVRYGEENQLQQEDQVVVEPVNDYANQPIRPNSLIQDRPRSNLIYQSSPALNRPLPQQHPSDSIERELFRKQVQLKRIKDQQDRYRDELEKLFVTTEIRDQEEKYRQSLLGSSINNLIPLRERQNRASSALGISGSNIIANRGLNSSVDLSIGAKNPTLDRINTINAAFREK